MKLICWCPAINLREISVDLMALFRFVTGEVSTIVMKADEETVEARSQLEAVEKVLQVKSGSIWFIFDREYQKESHFNLLLSQVMVGWTCCRIQESDQRFGVRQCSTFFRQGPAQLLIWKRCLGQYCLYSSRNEKP